MNSLAQFQQDESGATAIEYGLIAAGISVAIIAVVNALGSQLVAIFTKHGDIDLRDPRAAATVIPVPASARHTRDATPACTRAAKRRLRGGTNVTIPQAKHLMLRTGRRPCGAPTSGLAPAAMAALIARPINALVVRSDAPAGTSGAGTSPFGAETMLVEAVSLLLFPAMMAFAASTDLFTMTISNRVPIVLAAGFLALALLDAMPLAEIGNHLAAGFVVLVVSFVFFSRGWIGGGDAKLAAATALWFGWAHLGDYLLIASVLGGVLTFAILEFRRRTLPPTLAGQAWLARLHEPNGGVPYGIALAAAALIVYPSTAWMAAAVA